MAKCCKYTAGMLNEPVTFQERSRVSDGAGGFTYSWADISGAPTMAMVKAMSGKERWQSQRVEASANYRVVTRYSSAIKENDRVLIRNRPGNIRFVNNVDLEDRWLEIDVDLGVPT